MFTSLQIFCYILHYQLLVKSLVSQSYMRIYFLGLILSFSPFPGNAPCKRGKFKILYSYFFHDNLSYWLSEWISSNPFTLISVFPCSSPSFASPRCLFPFGNVLTRTTCNIHHDWGCPARWSDLPPWRRSEPTCTSSWATCSRWLCCVTPLYDPHKSLPISIILWFCNSNWTKSCKFTSGMKHFLYCLPDHSLLKLKSSHLEDFIP